MCTLFIYRKKNTKWPVLIATNRDEFFKRKFFSPNKHWSSNIDIFAGKDTLKGGSWLGINKSHLCAVVLNRDSNSIQLKETKSRGNLVLNILKKKSTKEAVDFIAKQKFNKYKYFNLQIQFCPLMGFPKSLIEIISKDHFVCYLDCV